MKLPVVLAVGGSDCSGGAGIQADTRVLYGAGCYPASVITALTVQNTKGVQQVEPVAPRLVEAQLKSVFEDLAVNAVKLGMLANDGVLRVVAATLREFQPKIVVLDPVFNAESGGALLSQEARETLLLELGRLVTVITPNIPEAAALLDWEEADVTAQPDEACRTLRSTGIAAVLLTGGHGRGEESIDYLHCEEGEFSVKQPRVDTSDTHGSGCSFASRLTAELALGNSLPESAATAQRFIQQALKNPLRVRLGQGRNPLFRHVGRG